MPVLCIAILFLLAASVLPAQEYRWVHQDSIANMDYVCVACADSVHCFAIGNDGGLKQTIRRSLDGGRTWERVYLDSGYFIAPNVPHEPLRLRRISCPVPGLCLVACDSGRILRSVDGGDTWAIVEVPVSEHIFQVAMYDARHGVCLSVLDKLLRTADSGASWQMLALADSMSAESWLNLTCLHGTPNIYALSRKRMVWRSNDGGDTWLRGGEAAGCSVITFISADSGWALGGVRTGVGDQERDVIRRTTDGGATWQTQVDSLIEVTAGLRNIAFADRLHGLAVGRAGKILRTSNAGEAWIQEWGGFTRDMDPTYLSVAYPSPSTALIVSIVGNILRQERAVGSVEEVSAFGGIAMTIAPNPARAGEPVRVVLGLPRAAYVRGRIVDMLGREVGTVGEGWLGPGEGSLALHAPAGPGAYMVELEVDGRRMAQLLRAVR